MVTAHLFLFCSHVLILFLYKRNSFDEWFVSMLSIIPLKAGFCNTELCCEIPSNFDMPEDIILEILLRLPVKTLLRFKCVCKHWYALIGSQSFVHRHFHHESNQERLVIRYYKPNDDHYSFTLVADEMCSLHEEPYRLQMPYEADQLIGPVNGIFCLFGLSREMAFLNPAMRQFKPLPLPCPDVEPHLCTIRSVFGFGLDRVSGHYKLVQIQYFWNKQRNVPHNSPLVSVYHSGNDSWRYFEDIALVNSSFCSHTSPCNTYLDGVYYWLVDYDHGNVTAALAFDMTTEKFQKIQVPDCIKLGEGYLALYGDSIALLSCDSDENDIYVDIWVMKKEGCWTKSSTVGPFQDSIWGLRLWKDSELLFQTKTSPLTLYNIFTQELRFVEDNDFFIHWVFSYKESLVSIKGEGDNCMLMDTSSGFVKYLLDEQSSTNKVPMAVYV